MADTYYTEQGKIVFNGDTARADDLNNINTAIDVAFNAVEVNIDNLELQMPVNVELARKWAEQTVDVLVDADSYSALHHATKAATSAATATTKASSATTSEANALSYKNTAEGARDTAVSSATSATASATSATTSAGTATTQATNASNSATTASTQAGIATTQAGIATTQASNASTSATSASNSASTATTQATNASSSASSASTSASNASTSATAAQSAKTAAESARDQTLTAFDNFDDRYLGSKAVAPTLDNDGSALLTGAMYWNSVGSKMYVYNGSMWEQTVVTAGDLALKANSANPIFTGTITGGTGVLNIGSGQIYKDATGNVGIGTSSPIAKLDVQIAGYEALRLTATTGTNGVYQSLFNTAGAFYVGRDSSTAGIFGFAPYAATMSSTGSYPMCFGTNNIERMRIDATGNVGIGISSPSTKLDVLNSIKVSSTSATFPTITALSTSAAGNTPPILQLYRVASNGVTPNSQTIGEIRFDGGNAAASYDNMGMISVTSGTNTAGGAPSTMSFYVATSGAPASERMRIDSSGNVGIGTASPQSILDLTGNDPSLRLTDNAGTTPGTWSIRSTDGSFAIRSITNSADRLVIDSNGNVLVTGSGGLGYGTGSGGTVTQATSKGVAVTLNKPCGRITTASDALASGSIAAFHVNNSLVSHTDIVILSKVTGAGDDGFYHIWTISAAGIFVIYIKNIYGASLSDAIQINFAIIKGVTS